MTWNNTEPSTTQFISAGQGTILNNFQFLGNTAHRDGTVVVNATSGNISTGGWYQLPNGLIFQYAKVTKGGGIANDTLVSYITAFPNGVLSVIFQPFTGQNGVTGNVATAGFSTSEFTCKTSITLASGAYYIAIGF